MKIPLKSYLTTLRTSQRSLRIKIEMMFPVTDVMLLIEFAWLNFQAIERNSYPPEEFTDKEMLTFPYF